MYHRPSFSRYNPLAVPPASALAGALSMHPQSSQFQLYMQVQKEKIRYAYGDYLKPVFSPEGDVILDVECGENRGNLYLSRFCQGSKGPCIRFDNAWLTPNEFQYVSGRESAKDWKRSIRHQGKSLKLLLAKGILSVHQSSCSCPGCRMSSPVNRGKLSTFNPRFGFEAFYQEQLPPNENGSDPGRARKSSGSEDDKEDSASHFSVSSARLLPEKPYDRRADGSHQNGKQSSLSTAEVPRPFEVNAKPGETTAERLFAKDRERLFLNTLSNPFPASTNLGKDVVFPSLFPPFSALPIHLNSTAMHGIGPLQAGFPSPHLPAESFYRHFTSMYPLGLPSRPDVVHPVFGDPSRIWRTKEPDTQNGSMTNGSGSLGAENLSSDTSIASSPAESTPRCFSKTEDQPSESQLSPLDLSVWKPNVTEKHSQSFSKPTNPPPDRVWRHRPDRSHMDSPYGRSVVSADVPAQKARMRIKAETFSVPREGSSPAIDEREVYAPACSPAPSSSTTHESAESEDGRPQSV